MSEVKSPRLPLEGVRIADFTWAWAGPYATELLAFLGAEVIKIESSHRPDHARIRSLTLGLSTKHLNNSPVFNDLNLNKMSLALDLTKPKAIDIAKKLVAVSDVVAENYRPGVMDKLGLGYDVLKKVKPDIVMLSSSALGSEGPESGYAGFAPTFAALGGAAHLTGYPDKRPVPLMGSSDLRSASTSAFAILVALYHRARTGEGQYIDLSSTETVAINISDAIIDYMMNGRVAVRKGNRDESLAPHNVYPCKNDRWVSIVIATENEWAAFCAALGNPSWIKEERFSDANSRWLNQDELDKLIGEWTVNYTHYEAMELLQKAGVAAVAALQGVELYSDPHLKERKVSVDVVHPNVGKRVALGPPWKFSATPAKVKHCGPLLGEHTDYVLGDILGMSKDEIAGLKEEGILS
ncbi:MAG: CoA transferase [Dehalococcoidia bacterium]|jgi:benzylsuccinate CoA-transferase BbsF subunit